MTVISRKNDNQAQEFVDRLVQTLLHPSRSAFLEERRDCIERLRLTRRQLLRFKDPERGRTWLVRDEGGGRRASEGELILRRRRDRAISFEVRQPLQGIRRRDIRLVRREDHRLPALSQRPCEAKQVVRGPPGHLRIERRLAQGRVDLYLSE